VLILRFTEREVSLGGAANAAHNVHDLGARVVPVGVVARTPPATSCWRCSAAPAFRRRHRLRDRSRDAGEDTHHGRRLPGHATAGRPPRSRAGARAQPITEDALLTRLTSLAARADAILVSDYGYGTVTGASSSASARSRGRTGAW